MSIAGNVHASDCLMKTNTLINSSCSLSQSGPCQKLKNHLYDSDFNNV